jgi:hypothetical protein
MQNTTTRARRTLGVRTGYEVRADALTVEQRAFYGQQQTPRRAAGSGKPANVWSMPFETKCLLLVDGPDPKDMTGRKLFCEHVRGDGQSIGRLLARLPLGSPVPVKGALIQASGLVNCRANGRNAPLVSLDIKRWERK